MEKGVSLLSEKVEELKESIVGSAERKGIISKQHVINGFSNRRYFDRVTMLDWAVSVVVLTQLLLLHCYVVLLRPSLSSTSPATPTPPGSYPPPPPAEPSRAWCLCCGLLRGTTSCC
jgi:hypothetical protein